MKPLHVGLLVVAGGIVGAVVMRVSERPQTAVLATLPGLYHAPRSFGQSAAGHRSGSSCGAAGRTASFSAGVAAQASAHVREEGRTRERGAAERPGGSSCFARAGARRAGSCA